MAEKHNGPIILQHELTDRDGMLEAKTTIVAKSGGVVSIEGIFSNKPIVRQREGKIEDNKPQGEDEQK
jgi:hypothetical protein